MRRVSTRLPAAVAPAIVVLVGGSLSAQNPGGSPEAKKVKNPAAASPASIAAGKATFLYVRSIGPQTKK